jgi:hypothetical protein
MAIVNELPIELLEQIIELTINEGQRLRRTTFSLGFKSDSVYFNENGVNRAYLRVAKCGGVQLRWATEVLLVNRKWYELGRRMIYEDCALDLNIKGNKLLNSKYVSELSRCLQQTPALCTSAKHLKWEEDTLRSGLYLSDMTSPFKRIVSCFNLNTLDTFYIWQELEHCRGFCLISFEERVEELMKVAAVIGIPVSSTFLIQIRLNKSVIRNLGRRLLKILVCCLFILRALAELTTKYRVQGKGLKSNSRIIPTLHLTSGLP